MQVTTFMLMYLLMQMLRGTARGFRNGSNNFLWLFLLLGPLAGLTQLGTTGPNWGNLFSGANPFDNKPWNPFQNLLEPQSPPTPVSSPINPIPQPTPTPRPTSPITMVTTPVPPPSLRNWLGTGTEDDPYDATGGAGPVSEDIGWGYGVNDDVIF